MKLIIAEKPAMGRDIAQALSGMLGQPIRADSARMCQWVGDYAIVGAQGHLFRLVDAEHYGDQFAFPWKLNTLPVLPAQFLLEPAYEKLNGKVVNSSLTQSIKRRLVAIKSLIADAHEVCHAGDPDREGQAIIDDILREFNFTGPVKRLWLHAQTNDGIIEAFKSMKDNQNYATLGLAAVARRESDWAIGINATRGYSTVWWKRGHKGLLNIGRVVTPLVGMVVQRENDITSFVPIEHYSLIATVDFGKQEPFVGEWQLGVHEGDPRFDARGKLLLDRAKAEQVQRKCTGKQARVILAEKKPLSESPPLLFSLVELQKAAARMGYSPDEVLAAAQALYEKHKLTSYPRTECQYAPESELKVADAVINAIKSNFGGQFVIPQECDTSKRSSAWDDKKLGDHFAIIPLVSSCPVGNLSRCELDVYRLVCRQYLAQFLEPYKYMQSAIEVEIDSHRFRATGRTPVSLGWRVLFGGAQKKFDSTGKVINQAVLPNIQVNDFGDVVKMDLKCAKTEPPKRFTAITLLEAMEKAYLFVTDPKVRAKLKDVEGIGTAATRSGIISKAVSTALIVEDKSNKIISYRPTPKAFGYILSLPNVLTKPDLTAWFEGKLESIKNGSLEYSRYREVLTKLVSHVLESAVSGQAYNSMPGPSDLPQPVQATSKSARKPRKSPAVKRKKVAA
ncbi:DNA topoisomerase [Rhodoferax antarcticus]|uniref:DNA topoisomerase n=1 Tax=Rhodoferax antarcticus ANT.BR TaxID=1111071 RepID=A0A1Q8Y9G5_9BURK|nr:DNA topoisomerase [Rhodoferax antarcticus]OLP04643.1 DNA topoisomerase family protein [Rhodoferax antarcticus ANT.BR]